MAKRSFPIGRGSSAPWTPPNGLESPFSVRKRARQPILLLADPINQNGRERSGKEEKSCGEPRVLRVNLRGGGAGTGADSALTLGGITGAATRLGFAVIGIGDPGVQHAAQSMAEALGDFAK